MLEVAPQPLFVNFSRRFGARAHAQGRGGARRVHEPAFFSHCWCSEKPLVREIDGRTNGSFQGNKYTFWVPDNDRVFKIKKSTNYNYIESILASNMEVIMAMDESASLCSNIDSILKVDAVTVTPFKTSRCTAYFETSRLGFKRSIWIGWLYFDFQKRGHKEL